MVTSLKNLKDEVDSRLAGGGLEALACCQLQNAETILDNNIVYSVPNIASLPDVKLNEGRFIYVEDINEYRFSNKLWTDDPSSTVCVYQNQLWTWGSNSCGTLGDGTMTNRCSPVREISSSTNWCQVSISVAHTAVIKTSGELWAWGCGDGRLGNGTITPHCSPVREFCSATDWCQVSAGFQHTVAIKTSGELWAWGPNGSGGLGDGTITQRCSPVREFCSATDWCQVSAGGNFTAAIKTSGQIWAWGRGNYSSLGDGTALSRCSPVREISSSTDWCQVSAGRYHTIAIKTSNELWAWGRNNVAQLGDGTVTQRCSPVREISSSTDWCQTKQGGEHTVAIKTSGELWAWGNNACGRLGDGTLTNRCSPVREICSSTDWCQASGGTSHTAALKTSGELWAWGSNASGQLADGTIITRCSPVREISFSTDWCQVDARVNINTAAIKAVTTGFLE
jgi:alpha-tubulin suppressor-like RCC1 family protein